MTCSNCNRRGHIARDCRSDKKRKFKQDGYQANNQGGYKQGQEQRVVTGAATSPPRELTPAGEWKRTAVQDENGNPAYLLTRPFVLTSSGQGK